jgi:hypothetical protein
VVVIEIYNFDVGGFAIRGRLKNFNFKIIKTSAILSGPQMFSNQKVINYKVIRPIDIYNFGFGRFSIQGH